MSRDSDGGEDRLAPIIPLFGGRIVRASDIPADDAHQETAHQETAHQEPTSSAVSHPAHAVVDGAADPDPASAARRAEDVLVRKLRARSLSVSEARQVLRGQDLDAAGVDDVIDRFCERGYLDDALLAEHLVISGIERKGQGRVALSRSLSQRGIPRDIVDAALGDLPDDDAERALKFARTKARSLMRLDFDTALRRLVGQLARRGYGGSIATTAARAALTEASLGASTSGVRFVDSD